MLADLGEQIYQSDLAIEKTMDKDLAYLHFAQQ